MKFFSYIVVFITLSLCLGVSAEASPINQQGKTITATPTQLAAVRTKRTVKAVERTVIPPKPYQQVSVTVSSPASSLANKPFIVVYRFASPVTGFNRGLIRVNKGKLTYFAGNKAKTVYRILVVPDKNLHLSDNPISTVTFLSPTSGELRRDVRIIAAASKTNSQIATLEPSLLAQIVGGYGGDNITESNMRIGNTRGIQLGFTYPLPSISTILDKIIQRGSVRVHLGYEEQVTGSKSAGTYNKFQTTTGDLLYEILFSGSYKFIGGMTLAYQPTLDPQDLKLRDLSSESGDTTSRIAKVTFENAYGAKLLLEYNPFTFSERFQFFVNGGITILDYLPKEIVLDASSNDDDILARPTRVGSTSFRLALGVRY